MKNFLVASMVSIALGLTGMSVAYSYGCGKDDQCGSKQKCLHGTCTEVQCKNKRDCAKGETCTDAGVCEKNVD